MPDLRKVGQINFSVATYWRRQGILTKTSKLLYIPEWKKEEVL
ncbi:Hypothetical protein LUCI_0631 [Lucifera butyrica]|uniref:Uncharacterized protein n=1 Tax=Lucifera butyrica TaxID=1351585 RepID=A0A498R585_9FIRM|nr:hypothetical protein [Lucifera butyrica]VBB05422.1 Hypothetical protein LUCI_0631 [Lucifera butyrica]